MLNLLIANKNLKNLQGLQNYISQCIPEIRVGYIATNGKEVLDVLNKQHYDIVLIDNNLPIYDGFEILQKLSKIKKLDYYKSFIILSDNSNSINLLKSHDLVYTAFSNSESFSKIISTLNALVKEQETKSTTSYIRNKIINELKSIGFNLSHKGTHYLAESMVLISTLNYSAENLSKNIYPKISTIYQKDLNNIKCNITTATDAACKNISTDMLHNYFGLTCKIKPTTKMIIYSVLQKI